MDALIPIPSDETSNDFDFIKKITTVAVSVLVIGLTYFTWQIITGEISLTGPNSLVLEKETDFDSLVQFDDVDNLSGDGVSVCIVDSGLDDTHRDLGGLNLKGWFDFIGGISSPYDDNGHGTMMAGILVADGGLTGIARDIDLYVAKALAGNGSGDDSTVAEAIDWCISSGVNIISLSLGGATSGAAIIFGDAVEDAVDSAYDAGIVVVAAAGNDGEDDDGDVASPGTVDTVICVGGVDASGNLWSGSSVGDNNGRVWPILLPRNSPDEKPEVVAPGHNVPVIIPGDSWGLSSGTSAATVYVTGAVALLFDAHPDLIEGGTNMLDNLKQWIADSSQKRNGQDNHDDYYGYGLLQIKDLIATSQA
ncbi:MAG: S8 family serine peptidase [Euryarchaeota archaeon]|jgi:serine protease AprX|nr:S8 family serine peptidase [Euryarchaeota archaeon]MBT4981828.1 S8 family serine peptidase [Euryarchaeota archaeon]